MLNKQLQKIFGTKIYVFILLSWIAFLYLAAILANTFIQYDPSFPYAESRLAASGLPKILYSWANFDGVHYLTIAQDGYLGTGLIQAFFPVFPLLLRLASVLGISVILFGHVLNLVAVCAVVFLLLALLDERVTSEVQKRNTVLAFLTFPTSFFLISVYTESIFILLVVGTFLAIARKRWYVAAILIGIATATRLVGIFLIPSALFALIIDNNKIIISKHILSTNTIHSIKTKLLSGIALIIIGSEGLIAYMYYLYVHFGNPFYFFSVQSEFGGGREESLVLFPQVLFRYLKILYSYRPFGLVYYASMQELVLTMFACIGLFISWKKKLVPSHQIVFAVAAVLLPTVTGTFSSMPRYVLVAIPAFSAVGWLLTKYPKILPWWIATSTFFLIFNTILFVQGYWVA